MIVHGSNHASKVGDRNRANPDLRARSVRDLRAKPESRAKPEKKREREGLGRGLGEPLSDFKSFNLVCICY